MERILIFIKHHLGFIWRIIEEVNGLMFMTLFGKRLQRELPKVFVDAALSPYSFRELKLDDMRSLSYLLASQPASDLEYFKPHEFDLESLIKQKTNRAFLMMGVWSSQKLVGYFFLRFFMNKKCFVGRVIDKEYRGMGIGQVMNQIMYETAWRIGFRCMSTISRKNTAVMRAHEKNRSMVILKNLPNDYLLVEFIKRS